MLQNALGLLLSSGFEKNIVQLTVLLAADNVFTVLCACRNVMLVRILHHTSWQRLTSRLSMSCCLMDSF